MLFSLSIFLCVLVSCLADTGTTLTIEQIMKGRCYNKAGTDPYLRTLNWDCEAIYNNFSNTYFGQDPLSITNLSFQPFLAASRHPVPINKSMFWTGSSSVSYNPSPVTTPNRDIVHEYSYFGLRFWTLEDSMWGSMLNGLNFCGADLDYQLSNSSIYNFSECMAYGSAGSSSNFWTAASQQFAQLATGDVHMLGYANNRPIYRTGADGQPPSIFASVEIKNLNASQITSFTALIIPNAQFPDERCGAGTVAQMQSDLTTIAGIPPDQVFCVDDPDAVRHVICIDDWFTPQCQFFTDVQDSGLSKNQIWGVAFVIGWVGGIATLVVAFLLLRRRKSNEETLLVAPERGV